MGKLTNKTYTDHLEQTFLPSSSRHILRFTKARNEFLELLSSNGYVLVGQYTGVDSPVDAICPAGHLWRTCCFTNFKAGVRCRICAKQCHTTTKNIFYENLNLNGYQLVSTYKNVMTNVTVICPEGHEWNTCNPGRFNQGVRCRICDGQDKDLARKRFETLLESRGDINLTNYEGANKKVVIKFGRCGHIVDKLTPSKYKNRLYCPECSKSKKESHLATFTKEAAKRIFKDVEFEYRILKNNETNYYLPFDIYIPSVNALVEIQGHQHYRYNTLYHKDESDFLYRQKLDEYKKEWAISKNYRFIEIDIRNHSEDNVLEILQGLKKLEDAAYEYKFNGNRTHSG